MATELNYQAGDSIWVFESSRWGDPKATRHKVDRVTPTGRLNVGPYKFNSDGREIGNHYGPYKILPKEKQDAEAAAVLKIRVHASLCYSISVECEKAMRGLRNKCLSEAETILRSALERIEKHSAEN